MSNLGKLPHLLRKSSLPLAGAAAVALLAASQAAPAQQAGASKAQIARGNYIVNSLAACANCHTPRNPDGSPQKGKDFAGGLPFDDPVLGTVYARNLTPDKDTGIGSWTDEQIMTAFRTGKNKEGDVLMPPMPYPLFNNMSDDDAKAVVAYLRSLPAVHNEVPADKLKVPRGQAMPPAKGAAAPKRGATAAYGKYLLTAVIDCMDCHSTPVNGQPDKTGHLGAGGFKIDALGLTQMSANITPDKKTGIGTWTDNEIKQAITAAKSKKVPWPIFPVMPVDFYKTMTPGDLSAIVAYLRTIPAIENDVQRKDWRPPPPPKP